MTATSLSRGMSTVTRCRLCSRAPTMRMLSAIGRAAPAPWAGAGCALRSLPDAAAAVARSGDLAPDGAGALRACPRRSCARPPAPGRSACRAARPPPAALRRRPGRPRRRPRGRGPGSSRRRAPPRCCARPRRRSGRPPRGGGSRRPGPPRPRRAGRSSARRAGRAARAPSPPRRAPARASAAALRRRRASAPAGRATGSRGRGRAWAGGPGAAPGRRRRGGRRRPRAGRGRPRSRGPGSAPRAPRAGNGGRRRPRTSRRRPGRNCISTFSYPAPSHTGQAPDAELNEKEVGLRPRSRASGVFANSLRSGSRTPMYVAALTREDAPSGAWSTSVTPVRRSRPVDPVAGPGLGLAEAELPAQVAVEHLVHERGLAGARDAGHAHEQAEGDRDRDVPEVVLARTPDEEAPGGVGLPTPRGARHRKEPREVHPGLRAGLLEQARDRALVDDLAALAAGPRAEVDDVVGGGDERRVVLDHDHRVAGVRQPAQDAGRGGEASRGCRPTDGSSST